MKNITRIVISAILLFVLVVGIIGALDASAATNEPQHAINVSATACKVDQSGYVDFVVSSWVNESPKGDNDDILVQYQDETEDGNVSGYTDLMHGKFTQSGNYRFASTLYITGDVKRLSLIITAVGAWGDGFNGGQIAYLEAFPEDCDGVTGSPIVGEPMYKALWLPLVVR